jgi:hypothetical protein
MCATGSTGRCPCSTFELPFASSSLSAGAGPPIGPRFRHSLYLPLFTAPPSYLLADFRASSGVATLSSFLSKNAPSAPSRAPSTAAHVNLDLFTLYLPLHDSPCLCSNINSLINFRSHLALLAYVDLKFSLAL